MDPVAAQDALVAHLEAAAPWGVRVDVEREASGEPFQNHTGGPAYAALGAAMEEAYGRPLSTLARAARSRCATSSPTPRPFRFFTWIVWLLTLVAVLAPFMTGAKLATQVATAAIYL